MAYMIHHNTVLLKVRVFKRFPHFGSEFKSVCIITSNMSALSYKGVQVLVKKEKVKATTYTDQ